MSKKSCSSVFIKERAILYCNIKLFTKTTAAELKKALTSMNFKKVRGIIIDLRTNRGGLLEAAIDSAALFVEKNTLIVTTKNLQKESIAQYRTEQHPLLKAIPVILLINKETASAAEIYAQALRVYAAQSKKRFFTALVGAPTAGKGSLQKIQQLSQGHALKITTAYSYMADGTCFHGKGISPDFYLEESSLKKGSAHSFVQSRDTLTLLPDTSIKMNSSPLLSDPSIACGCTLIALLSHLRTSTSSCNSSYKSELLWLQNHYINPTKAQKSTSPLGNAT